MSTLTTLITEAYEELQEDINTPLFWPLTTCRRYVWLGLRDILKRTHINLSERAIPMYTQVVGTDEETGDPVFENASGFFSPPISQVQRITAIFWKGTNGKHQLQVKKPYEMDLLDPNWEDATGDTPVYAVECSGNYNKLNMQVDDRRNGIKFKLYPTPPDMDPELQAALYQLQGIGPSLENYSISQWGSLFGGLASNTNTEGIAWGIDTNGDGVRDDIPVSESTVGGLLVSLMNGSFDISAYSNYPIIRYVPDFDRTFFNTVDGSEWDLDSFLPTDLQIALQDYMRYRCYHKEGEANDEKRAAMAEEDYEKLVNDYVAENHLYETPRLTPDSNFQLGREDNRLDGTSTANPYYDTLRI